MNNDKLINDSLTMYHVENKIRLGSENDGGYVIMELDDYDYLLSDLTKVNPELAKLLITLIAISKPA